MKFAKKVFKKVFSNKKDVLREKNKKLAQDIVRIKINSIRSGSLVTTHIFDAKLVRDEFNNSVLFNEDMNFKERMPGDYESIISDVLYKLSSGELDIKQQLDRVKSAIKSQESLINSEKGGYIQKKVVTDNKEDLVNIKINVMGEKTKLRLLKVTRYTLENKKGAGSFETVEIDGTRCLSYVVRGGNIDPIYFKSPESEGEPMIAVPDIAQKKVLFKSNREEAINDFNESTWFAKGVLGAIGKVLFVLFFCGLLFWTFQLARWQGDLYDEALQPQLDKLKVENERIRQLCSVDVANQIENNGVLIDYANKVISGEIATSQSLPEAAPDNANIQI